MPADSELEGRIPYSPCYPTVLAALIQSPLLACPHLTIAKHWRISRLRLDFVYSVDMNLFEELTQPRAIFTLSLSWWLTRVYL